MRKRNYSSNYSTNKEIVPPENLARAQTLVNSGLSSVFASTVTATELKCLDFHVLELCFGPSAMRTAAYHSKCSSRIYRYQKLVSHLHDEKNAYATIFRKAQKAAAVVSVNASRQGSGHKKSEAQHAPKCPMS